ncbi:MAG: hypothetical protein AB8H79_11305 [Myxococcota bacterium]
MSRFLTCVRGGVLAIALLSSGASTMSHAEPARWTEAKLVSHDEMEILYGLTETLLQSGKIDGARAALLASTDGLRQSSSRAHLPAVAKQLQAYQALAPRAYSGSGFRGDEAAFRALISAHLPALQAAADNVALPPTGAPFTSASDQVQRVVQAKESIANAAAAAKAYAQAAPNPEAHLALSEAQPVTAALRHILFGMIALNDHMGMATQTATERAADWGRKTDDALAAEQLGMISLMADQEHEFGTYLEKLGQGALGAQHIAHAKHAIAKEQAIREAQIAANRLPAESYAGGDAAQLRGLAKSQFLNAFPGDEVLAVSLVSQGAVERREWVKLDGGGWAWRRIRRFQWAHIAHRPKGGGNECRTYPVRIEQQWNGSGWGAHYTYKPVHIYGFSMLCENL